MGFNLPVMNRLRRSGRALSPASLFATGAPGAIFDPRDLTTMFQDSAGTTPVTAPGQPVGLRLDKSGRGNHATQATAGARLTYGIEPKTGTRNLLLATDTLTTQSLTVAAVPHTLAFTGTGTVTLSGASTAGPLVGTGAGNRVTLTFTPTAASLTLTVSGSVTLGQLQLGSTDTPYQKVVTAFEVTEAGVPTCHYCAYAGANSMATAAIDFTATDKMSVFTGVRKLSDAAQAAFIGLSIAPSTNSGTFELSAPGGGLSGEPYNLRSRGTSNSFASAGIGYSAPITNIITALGDIAGDLATLRINGSQVAQATTDQGTGTFGNYPLYLGRRGGSTLPFNGRDYGILVVGKATSADEISITEAWLAANTPTVVL